MTEEQRQALKQILEAVSDQFRLTGKWSYFAPGGWAGDRLTELLAGPQIIWQVAECVPFGGDHPVFSNLEIAKRYVEAQAGRTRQRECIWDKSNSHGEVHYFIPSILHDAAKNVRRERAWYAIIRQEVRTP